MDFNKNLDDDSELDRLLGHAQWPEPSAEQMARVRERWQAIARRRRVRRLSGACAMAASLLVIAAMLVLRNVERSSAPKTAPTPPTLSVATAAQPRLAGWSVQSREANVYERVVLMETPAKRPVRRSAAARSKLDTRVLEELIAMLAKDADADIDGQLKLMAGDVARYERALWDIAREANPERRLGAARVLARMGTAQSLPILVGLLNEPATHEAAVLGLCRLGSPAYLARLATIESDATPRRKLFAALLERRTEESVGLYLNFVNEPGFRDDALAAAAITTDPPVDLLLNFLENSQKSVRLAAALALGRLPNADFSQRLGESTLAGIGRQEAIIALLLSHDAQAARWLNQARQDLYLVASVQAAEQELHSLMSPR